MGVDLRLLPFDCDSDGLAFSHTILDIERRRDLWDPIAEIEKAKGTYLPDNFYAFCALGSDGDPCYGPVDTDPYGSRVKYIHAGDLYPLSGHECVLDNWKNRAVWAYLKELPPSTKVALFWH